MSTLTLNAVAADKQLRCRDCFFRLGNCQTCNAPRSCNCGCHLNRIHTPELCPTTQEQPMTWQLARCMYDVEVKRVGTILTRVLASTKQEAIQQAIECVTKEDPTCEGVLDWDNAKVTVARWEVNGYEQKL